MKKVLSRIKEKIKEILNFIKKHKKKVLIGLAVFIILFLPTFLYINLTNPTLINKYIASVANKGVPANNAFEDQIFYNAVIDAYNKENNTNLPYTTNLTDEQLKTITKISYSGSNKEDSEKISSTKGIEKLTSLTDLDLGYNNISSIDLSENTKLTSLNLSENNLSSIDLSKNTELTGLNLGYNNLSNIDLSKNTLLTELDLNHNNLHSIDISKNTELTDLDLSVNNLSNIDLSKNTELTDLDLGFYGGFVLHGEGNQLETIDLSNNIKLKNLTLSCNVLRKIDLSKNTELTGLNLGYNNLSNIDLSKNTELTGLDLGYNNLSNIDLSQNTELTYLNLDSNNLSSIDLSKNIELTYLDLDSNNLSSIDLSKNTELTSLNLSENNLSSIDLSKNIELTYLNLSENNLSSIDLSKNIELTYLNLSDNNSLKIIKLYDNFNIVDNIISAQAINQTYIDFGKGRIINSIEDYKLYLNNKLVIKESVDVDTLIRNLGLKNITAKVYDKDNQLVENNVSNNDILKLYYNDEEIQSIPIHIFNNEYFDDENFYNAVVDAYNEKNNENLPYTTNLTDEQLKTITEISYNGYDKEDSEKINSTKGIEKLTSLTELYLVNNNLNGIDLSKNTELTSLVLSQNNLSNIDLSKNIELTSLNLGFYGGTPSQGNSNRLRTIDLSNNIKLQRLSLSSNLLREIDLSKNTELTDLDLNHNNLHSIDLSKNTLLTELDLNHNFLRYIDLSKNTELTDLDLSVNNLSNIDLSQNTLLTDLDLSSNNLNSIDISKNTELTSLYLDESPGVNSQNLLEDIDLSNNIKLQRLFLSSNLLREIDLSKNTELTDLDLSVNNLSNIDLSQNTLLTDLDLSSNNLNSIDLSRNTALMYLDLYNNPFDLETYRMMLGKTVDNYNNIKLPKGSEKFYITYKVENEDIASYNDGVIKGLKTGTTKLKATLNGVKSSSSSSSSDMVIEGVIKVFDIKSDKYVINKENKYIYTKTDIDNNTILKNITVENGTGKIENNEFKVIDEDVVVETYKIVNISSDKYDLSKDNIRLKKNETFDIHSVNITNGQLEYKDNKLYVKYGDDVLKVYTITQTTRTKGDVNNDDKITVVDVSLLYRHVKKKSVITDSETLSISDINADNKITVTDVSMIYRFVKGKIDEL